MSTMSAGRPLRAEDLADLMAPAGAKVELLDGIAVMTSTGEPFTRAHRDALPEDGRRHELIDGALFVTPSPNPRHQSVVVTLVRTLTAVCPPDLQVFVAPLDVSLPAGDIMQPDLLVTRRSSVTDAALLGVPLLVVEILSPRTRTMDLTVKKDLYQAAGCSAYWVVDPEVPRLLAWELHDGAYVEVADVSGDDPWTAGTPYAVTLTPAGLLR